MITKVNAIRHALFAGSTVVKKSVMVWKVVTHFLYLTYANFVLDGYYGGYHEAQKAIDQIQFSTESFPVTKAHHRG